MSYIISTFKVNIWACKCSTITTKCNSMTKQTVQFSPACKSLQMILEPFLAKKTCDFCDTPLLHCFRFLKVSYKIFQNFWILKTLTSTHSSNNQIRASLSFEVRSLCHVCFLNPLHIAYFFALSISVLNHILTAKSCADCVLFPTTISMQTLFCLHPKKCALSFVVFYGLYREVQT